MIHEIVPTGVLYYLITYIPKNKSHKVPLDSLITIFHPQAKSRGSYIGMVISIYDPRDCTSGRDMS